MEELPQTYKDFQTFITKGTVKIKVQEVYIFYKKEKHKIDSSNYENLFDLTSANEDLLSNGIVIHIHAFVGFENASKKKNEQSYSLDLL